MTYSFRPAVRENAGALVALAGPSGGGKTMSALRLARGLVGPQGVIAFIDTEARRATHYADKFQFLHGDLHPPFRPDTYIDAILDAEKTGAGAVIIDSMSHVWSGTGGVLDWQEEEVEAAVERAKTLAAKKGWEFDEYRAREANKMAAWIKPKMSHKKMMSRLLQCRAHLIFCLRAEEKVKMEKNERNQTVIVPIGWQPICEKNFMYEMTTSFLLTDDAPGVPKPIKLQDQHRAFFPTDKPISEKSGELLAAWAAGGKSATVSTQAEKPTESAKSGQDNSAGETRQPEPPNHPFAIMDGEGTEHLYPKGSEYLTALEKLFDEAPDAFGFWDSNSEHFTGWQTKLLEKAQREDAKPADKKASDAFNVVGKRLTDRLAMLAKAENAA